MATDAPSFLPFAFALCISPFLPIPPHDAETMSVLCTIVYPVPGILLIKEWFLPFSEFSIQTCQDMASDGAEPLHACLWSGITPVQPIMANV